MAAVSYRICRACTFILCLIGMSASFYSYYVEISKERDSNFKAACDISESMSCSKVFTSKYGRGFGLLEHIVGRKHWLNQPNSVFGMAFYSLQVYLAFQNNLDSAVVQVVFCAVANISSVYLGYILYFVLEDFCVVCVSMYVTNFLLLMCAVIRKRKIEQMLLTGKTKSTKKTQ